LKKPKKRSPADSPMTSIDSLRALRNQPFELLAQLERMGRHVVGTRDGAVGNEWVGVAFRVGSDKFLIAREDMREVLSIPADLTRVPGARSWIRGLANVRGQLLPVIDLRSYLGSGMTSLTRTARILVANSRDTPSGFLVDEVLGFRRFADSDFDVTLPTTLVRCEQYLKGSFRRDADVWPVFSLKALIDSPSFLQVAS